MQQKNYKKICSITQNLSKIIENFPNLSNPAKFVQKCLRHNLWQVRKKCDTFLKNHSFPPISQVTHKKNEVHFYFSRKCVSSKKNVCKKFISTGNIENYRKNTIFDNFWQILQFWTNFTKSGKISGKFSREIQKFPRKFPGNRQFWPYKISCTRGDPWILTKKTPKKQGQNRPISEGFFRRGVRDEHLPPDEFFV